MALSVLALLVVAFAVAVWFATAVHNDVPALCSRPDKASLDTKPACLFSSDYDTARWRFREAVTDARNAELFSIDVAEGLSTDVALFNREACARGVLLHTSGVHGVEGFVGSAVQLGMVPLLANDSTTCVVLVHAVNPFGFAHLRRCNEHGVDLNRNALFDERAWREVLERDPNVAGYADVRDLVNPPHAPSGVALAVARIAVTVARHGMAKLKAAIVTGTYTCASCLFYGGRSLQRSHALLAQFLRDQKVLLGTRRVFHIDVHSGLGPTGLDSLMVSDAKSAAALRRLVAVVQPVPAPHSIEGGDVDATPGSAAAGYSLVRGDSASGYGTLFATDDRVGVTQEFGTVSSLRVFFALQRENQAFHFSESRVDRDYYSRALREAFNPESQSFRESVVLRGRRLLEMAIHHLSQP